MEGLLIFFAVLLFFGWLLIGPIWAYLANQRSKELETQVRHLTQQLGTAGQTLEQLQQRIQRLEQAPHADATNDTAAAPANNATPLVLPISDPAPKPVSDPTSEPAPAPAPALASTSVPSPTPAPILDLLPDPVPAPVPARAIDPVPALMPDPVSATIAIPASDPIPAAASVPASDPMPASASASAPPSRPAPAARTPVPRTPPPPTPDPAWLIAAKEWLFGGNLVAKMGLLILFIGVSFLLKFAASHISVPIEIRLAGVVLADIGLLLWGWRIRTTRPGIALPVQGAALAIMMMVTFAAFRIYHLIPSTLAFFLLFALTGFTCLLAVLQNAQWLAIFGIIGGFAAPILTSSGSGSHIALFSYYALLNTGIFVIARYQSWRSLNVLGFLFTFLIGTAWGLLRYEPAHYLSAQAFLILFFLFYVAIALLHATRQAPELNRHVDGTLVFGTPMLAFGLQFGLVKSFEMGLALSSLALGLFYMTLAVVLWKKRGGTLRLLVEAFLALGIVFGTLAIPFALDGRWTSGAWALEGAGILWIGLRQKQTRVWAFGLLVQIGAAVSFLLAISGLDGNTASNANLWLGFLLLAASAFVVAVRFREEGTQPDQAAAGQDANPWFGRFATLFLAGAAFWLVVGAWTEIFLHTDGATQATLVVVSALITATLLAMLAQKMVWPVARSLAMVVQVISGVLLLWLSLINLDWPERFDNRNLFDTPFLGALLICAASVFSAFVMRRYGSEAGQQAENEVGNDVSNKMANEADNEADNEVTNENGANHAARNAEKDTGKNSAGKTANNPMFGSNMLLVWSGFWWFTHVLLALSGWLVMLFAQEDAALPSSHLYHASYALLLAASGPLWMWAAQRWQWPQLRWLAVPTLLMLAKDSAALLIDLVSNTGLPPAPDWIAWLALWLASEFIMRRWQAGSLAASANLPATSTIKPFWLKVLHLVRVATPWLMLWPVGSYWIQHWLAGGNSEQQALLAQADWTTSASWARYIPVWLMMLATAWLMRCAQNERWPVAPLSTWYRTRLLPLACGWPLFLVAIWNLYQDGAMAPLPYVPLLNPLDLTTGFAFLQALACYRQLATPDETGKVRLPFMFLLPLYVWFNLMLLRSCSHWLDIDYSPEPLFMSGTVQVMLSLVWSITALILMRHATRNRQPLPWLWGAALLALVVGKLFLVDQANHGGVQRIIAFVGVGVLMLVIGYLAPYPSKTAPGNQAQNDAKDEIPPAST